MASSDSSGRDPPIAGEGFGFSVAIKRLRMAVRILHWSVRHMVPRSLVRHRRLTISIGVQSIFEQQHGTGLNSHD